MPSFSNKKVGTEDLMDPIIALMPSFTVGPGTEFVAVVGSFMEGREIKILELSLRNVLDAYIEVTKESSNLVNSSHPDRKGSKYWVSLRFLFEYYIPKEVLRDERD